SVCSGISTFLLELCITIEIWTQNCCNVFIIWIQIYIICFFFYVNQGLKKDKKKLTKIYV
ncbi:MULTISPECIES: hypothetical protein, partial [unclassified Flavobacterium]|uniref:hypothetical protein n=1 Tax=unclassified Flavobacterium TaxID=196869 RepID=UPI0025B8EBD8